MINAIINTLIVSIPEEVFLVVMPLILLKRFDMLDIRMWEKSIMWVAIPALPVAILLNVFRYIIPINENLRSISCLILLILLNILVVYLNSHKMKIKEILLTILYTLLSFIAMGVTETIYVMITLFLTKQSIQVINENIMSNFIYSSPSRIFQVCIIIFFVVKANNRAKINVFESILKNKFLTTTIFSASIFIILVMMYSVVLIGYDKILVNLTIAHQITVAILLLSIPIILLTWLWLLVNYIITKEKQMKLTYENLLSKDENIND